MSLNPIVSRLVLFTFIAAAQAHASVNFTGLKFFDATSGSPLVYGRDVGILLLRSDGQLFSTNSLPDLQDGLNTFQFFATSVGVSPIWDGGLIFEFEGATAGCTSGISVVTQAGVGGGSPNTNPLPAGLNPPQDGPCSTINSDSVWTDGVNTVELRELFFLNPGDRPFTVDWANDNPSGPFPFYGPDGFPDFDGGFTLAVNMPANQSPVPEPGTWMGVAIGILCATRWRKRR